MVAEFDSPASREESAWTRAQRMAFWINAYNAFTLRVIIDHYPIRSGWLTLPATASGRSMVCGQTFNGPPRAMMAMEMVEEAPADARLRRVFRDIKETMGLRSINSDYRTLALWPDYLEPAWAALKRVASADGYLQAAAMLATAAATAADRFPTPTSIDLRRLKSRGENTDALLEITHRFERLLPPLILNIALLARGWWPEDQLRRSPFPWLEAPGGADRSAS